jgi:hypothetical protein
VLASAQANQTELHEGLSGISHTGVSGDGSVFQSVSLPASPWTRLVRTGRADQGAISTEIAQPHGIVTDPQLGTARTITRPRRFYQTTARS